MSKTIPSYASFDKGITDISRSQDFKKLTLPQIAQFLPSDSKIESKLPELWKAHSLDNLIQETLMPTVINKDNLNPTIYQKKLIEAKKALIQKLKEEKERGKGKRRQALEDEDDEEELMEELIRDFDELEAHQELLWMLRQVVHLA